MRNFVRYFLASLGALALDYALTTAGLWLALPYYTALAVGVLAGAVTGYLLLTFWVFPARAESFSPRRMAGFASGVGLVYVVRTLIMWGWYRLAFPEAWVHVGLLLAYGTSFMSNFLYQKYLVFQPKGRPSS